MFKKRSIWHWIATCLTSALCLTSVAASGAVLTTYADLASFSAAAGAPLQSQDFEGIASGTNMSGVPILPGVSATTNMASLEIFSSVANPDHRLFGLGGRLAGNARYDISVGGARRFIAFDIDGFEAIPGDSSTATGPGQLTVFFADATFVALNVAGNLTGTPIFVGLGADVAITGLRWAEALEGNGPNEETALDNFRTTAAVPVPATLALFSLGLALLGFGRRRTVA